MRPSTSSELDPPHFDARPGHGVVHASDSHDGTPDSHDGKGDVPGDSDSADTSARARRNAQGDRTTSDATPGQAHGSHATTSHARAPGLSRSGESLRTGLLATIAVILAVAAMRATQTVSLPLAIAAFLVALLWPVFGWVRARRNRALAVAALLGALACLVAVMSGLVVMAFRNLADELAQRSSELEALYDRVMIVMGADPAAAEGAEAVAALLRRFRAGASGLVPKVLVRVGMIVTTGLLTILVAVEADSWRRRLGETLGDRVRLGAAATKFRRYIWTKTAVSIATGLATALACWLVGVDLVLVWALLGFALNYIPTLGPLVAVFPPVLLAGVDLGTTSALLLLAALVVTHVGLGQLLDPMLQGRTLAISPTVVLVSVLFWGWVWGVGGAILAIPLTTLVVMVSKESQRFHWFAELVAHEPEPSTSSRIGRHMQPE